MHYVVFSRNIFEPSSLLQAYGHVMWSERVIILRVLPALSVQISMLNSNRNAIVDLYSLSWQHFFDLYAE